MYNFIAYLRKGGGFSKSYWAKWPRKQLAFLHGRTVKGAGSNIFTCKPRPIFKTLELIRLSHILYKKTTMEIKRQIRKLSRANWVTIKLTVRAWSHEPGKQRAWTLCYRCPVSRLLHSPGRPASVITGKISTRDPGITILGFQLTGLARLSYNRKVDFCCV